MKKKIISAFISILTVAVLTGCGFSTAPVAVPAASETDVQAVGSDVSDKEMTEDVEIKEETTEETASVSLTTTECKALDAPLEAYLYEVLDAVDYEYEGPLSSVYAEFGGVCLSEEFASVEFIRTIYDGGSKVDYKAVCGDETLFYTDQYDSFPNTVETFSFRDLDGDKVDEVLVVSYTESTGGFLVTASSIFKYNGEKWVENVVYDYENGINDVSGADDEWVRDIILAEEGIVILEDSGEKNGAEVITELTSCIYRLADKAVELVEEKDELLDVYWPNSIF